MDASALASGPVWPPPGEPEWSDDDDGAPVEPSEPGLPPALADVEALAFSSFSPPPDPDPPDVDASALDSAPGEPDPWELPALSADWASADGSPCVSASDEDVGVDGGVGG